MFVGRDGVFEFLGQTLHGAYQENVVALIGPRRIGKTSILRQAERRLSDRYWPVFLDVQGILLRDVGSLWRALAERCRDVVGAQLAVPSAAEFASDLAALPRFLEGLTRAGGGLPSADGQKRLLIMLDEFDDLEHKVRSGLLPESAFAYLRHLIQHSPRIGFLLSGTNRLEELGGDYWSFLFNLAIYRKVGRLEFDEARKAITRPMAEAGIVCDDLAAYRTWELSGGHPYLLQLVGHHLVSRCQRLSCAHLDYDAVEGCIGEVMEWSESHLRYLWAQCDPVEQAMLAATHDCGCGGMTAADVAAVMRSHGCELASARLELALAGLVEKDLVALAGQVAARYRLTMGILGAWIERRHPLPRVVRRAARA
jgi:hypothetical protein